MIETTQTTEISTADAETVLEIEDDDELIPAEYQIASYGADYTVDSLVRRLDRGDIYVPSFQRSYVWTAKQASSFVESLLLGLPVPGIFLAKENDTNKLLVVDGQQRLTSLRNFYNSSSENGQGKQFALKEVVKRFNGRTYDQLEDDDRRRLDDSILHATVFRQENPSEDDSSIYNIFHRLNTGGTQLRPQEIRTAIYHGVFDELLGELNEDDNWRAVFGAKNRNMRDRELILRFCALLFEEYAEPMAKFLNNYMRRNRNLKHESEEQLRQAFLPTIQTVVECLGNRAFRVPGSRALNAAVYDSVMVGLARRLQQGPIQDCSTTVKSAYDELLQNEQFLHSITSTTGVMTSVATRLGMATRQFADLP